MTTTTVISASSTKSMASTAATAESCFGYRGIGGTECASWVQAWGSVLAILVAVGVFWAQGWRARRQARANLAGEAFFALNVIEKCESALNEFQFRLAMTSPNKWDFDSAQLDDAIALLREAYLAPMFPAARGAFIELRESLLVCRRFFADRTRNRSLEGAHEEGMMIATAAICDADEARFLIRQLVPGVQTKRDSLREQDERSRRNMRDA